MLGRLENFENNNGKYNSSSLAYYLFSPLPFFVQLRVDGVLMRLRDTRMHCIFSNSENPIVLRESCWREATFQALAEVSLLAIAC